MRKGFTLLELIVVIIIIGILATLGFTQYTRMIERSRGAEARAILGSIRTMATAYRLEHANSANGFTTADAGIGVAADQIPSACVATNYFSYAITSPVAGDTLVATGTRCVGVAGKQPGASAALTLILTSNFAAGTDTWTGTGGY